MMSAKGGPGYAPIRNWILPAMCWYALWGAGRLGYGQPELTHARERLTPKAWIQRYLGADFPGSAKHFVLYYRSSDEDTVLFSFDITRDDLGHLMDGRGIFPSYGDLAGGGPGLSERIVGDAGSQYFAQKVAALRNALSATRRRTSPAEPLEVRL